MALSVRADADAIGWEGNDVDEWPAGWFRDDGSAGAGTPGDGGWAAGPPGSAGMAPGGNDATVSNQRTTAWPSQPPRQTSNVYSPRPPDPGFGTLSEYRPRRRRGRLVLGIIAGLVAILLVAGVGGYFYLDSKLTRVNVLAPYPGVPAQGDGTNWLIAGSDARQGLTRAEQRQLHTGSLAADQGSHSDTLMILHIPSSGPPVLISVPRDSYVPIPGFGNSKITNALGFGGWGLTIKTLQNATGLRIDHFVSVGFLSLVNAVNAVGGVTLCVPHALRDAASGLHLHKGCNQLNGKKALAFVRTRHNFATQDLQREQNQRVFMKALLDKVTSTGVILNPFESIPAALGSVDSLTVDSGTHLNSMLSLALALRHPVTTTVPIANANYYTPAGDSVLWNRSAALTLFNDLNAGRPVPKSLIIGSKLAG